MTAQDPHHEISTVETSPDGRGLRTAAVVSALTGCAWLSVGIVVGVDSGPLWSSPLFMGVCALLFSGAVVLYWSGSR